MLARGGEWDTHTTLTREKEEERGEREGTKGETEREGRMCCQQGRAESRPKSS